MLNQKQQFWGNRHTVTASMFQQNHSMDNAKRQILKAIVLE